MSRSPRNVGQRRQLNALIKRCKRGSRRRRISEQDYECLDKSIPPLGCHTSTKTGRCGIQYAESNATACELRRTSKGRNVCYKRRTAKRQVKRSNTTEHKNTAQIKRPIVKEPKFDRELARVLRGIYKNIYAFPSWAIDKVAFSKWWPLLRRARIHFHAYDDQQLVTQLATEREPVNIAGRRLYDQDALKREFGWKTGLYGRYYNKHKRLAPNIGVFTPAVVKVESKYKHIYVYNAIGIAFDHKKQPDYQYYFGKPKPKYSELLTQYKHIFQRVYECAETNKLSTVVMSLVGGDNFATYYKPRQLTDKDNMESFRAEIWFPAFRIIRAKHKHISTIFMGTAEVKKEFEKEYGSDYHDIGYFPANTNEVDRKKTLFVNAWDPFSLPGNGNCHDKSLDGFMGCNTTIALTGSPMTNPFMSYQVHFQRDN